MKSVIVGVDKARIAKLRGEIKNQQARLVKVEKLITLAQPAFTWTAPHSDSASIPTPKSEDAVAPKSEALPVIKAKTPAPSIAVVLAQAAHATEPPVLNLGAFMPAETPIAASSKPSAAALPPKPIIETTTPTVETKASLSKPAVQATPGSDDSDSDSESEVEEDYDGNLIMKPKNDGKPAPRTIGLFDPKV